jgi:hypothetical protein
MGVVMVMMMMPGREGGCGAEHEDGENESLFHVNDRSKGELVSL